jgi:hypothetical protein
MSKATTLISTICAATLLATAANASFPNMTQNIGAHDGVYILAQTNGQERRDERQDGRQDCRQDEGVAGKDKRDCKQDERQDGDDASADTKG